MRAVSVFIVIGAALLLSGCVAGQKINIVYTPDACARIVTAQTATVQVSDARPYILNGDKTPQYIGHYRAGFGNTWPVGTGSKLALAEQFKSDVLKELQVLGVPVSGTQNSRRLQIEILDYNFDAYMNGKFWYDVKAEVLDDKGNVLAQARVKDTRIIKGNIWVGAKYAFQKQVPKIHHEIITQMLRNNPEIMNALK